MIEDNKIVDLFWNREEGAIKVLDEKYGNDFQCLSVRIVNNYEDAEECVSDSYYKTWNSIPDARPASLYAYVGKIVRNLSINKLKGKTAGKRDENKVDKLVEELDLCANSKENVESSILYKELSKTISQFLYGLKKMEMVMFVERYWYTYSIREIAEMHGVTEKKAEMVLYRLRKKLRKYLSERGYLV